ncbi:hypothetical protein C8R44DRAFT_824098, partial [Mycena epipterygia]
GTRCTPPVVRTPALAVGCGLSAVMVAVVGAEVYMVRMVARGGGGIGGVGLGGGAAGVNESASVPVPVADGGGVPEDESKVVEVEMGKAGVAEEEAVDKAKKGEEEEEEPAVGEVGERRQEGIEPAGGGGEREESRVYFLDLKLATLSTTSSSRVFLHRGSE